MREFLTALALVTAAHVALAQDQVAFLVSSQNGRSASGQPVVICVYRTHSGQLVERVVPLGSVCPSSIRL